MSETPELWNTVEVARFLGVKPGTVSAYRHRGQMPEPFETVGTRTHLWKADEIRRWQARRKAAAHPGPLGRLNAAGTPGVSPLEGPARAMLLREALSSVRMDRDETINLGPPTPHGENVTSETNYAVPPGEYITEWLEENKVSHAELEYGLGVSESYVTELIGGKMPINPSIAIQLENLTGIPVRSWNRLDHAYWQDRERLARQESIEQQRAARRDPQADLREP